MPVNRDFIGRSFPARTPFAVGREHIRQFASAVNDDNPAYHDVDAAKAAGYPDVVAPPTFLMALVGWRETIPMHSPELGLDYSRVVHGEQRFSLRRPIVAGDEISVAGSIINVRDLRGNDSVTIEYAFTTTSGEQLGTATTTIIVRGPDPEPVPEPAAESGDRA
jgi:acyl dehydratase